MERGIPEDYAEYFDHLNNLVKKELEIANDVRKAIGPTEEVEPAFVRDMAERVEFLVGPKGIAPKIRELTLSVAKEQIPFRLADEIVYSYEGKMDEESLIKQALVTSLAVMTPPCTTAAPSEGIARVKVKKNSDGSKYLAVYFAGPIRSAGGTELAASVVLADYIRRLVGLSAYKPTDEEVRRFVEELRTYKRRVMRFQYNVPDDIIEYILRNLPVEVTGIPTDKILTPSYRNLPRVETNYLRGGALRVVNDGIAGKAKKVLRLVENAGIPGWSWIEDVVKKMSKGNDEGSHQVEEVVAGRPIFSMNNRPGGLRLRYGRAPGTGMHAVGLHPMTMRVLHDYVVTGTQLKLDYPGKGGTVVPVDTIEPPIVLTRDGNVVKLLSDDLFFKVKENISKVIFLGDILVSFGDLIENNVTLLPCGYCEEWWAEELRKKLDNIKNDAIKLLRVNEETIKKLIEHPLRFKPNSTLAIKISNKLGIPLHPSYVYFWENIDLEDFENLRSWLRESIKEVKVDGDHVKFKFNQKFKEILNKIAVEHYVSNKCIKFKLDDLKAIIACSMPFKILNNKFKSKDNVIELINSLSPIKIRGKGITYLNARMGRPEKAGQREMKPPVHVLFPIGLSGGSSRDILTAFREEGRVLVEVCRRECNRCGSYTWKFTCDTCGSLTYLVGICESCKRKHMYYENGKCECNGNVSYSYKVYVDIRSELELWIEKLKIPLPSKIKGVKGLSSKSKQPEPLFKGILRAAYGLYVYKDGTIRFDSTNVPLTHFSPKQIGISVSKLRELGYTHDVEGKPLVSEEQILELKVQDVVISTKAADHLFKVSKFIDDILSKVLGKEPYYRCSSKEDIIGKLIVGLSPHTYAGVVGRVIGFVDGNVNFSHPVYHAAKRRDCDGDEDSVMLLLDVLINFSKLYLPDKTGGKMDSPLLITVNVYPEEVDEQVHNLDIAKRYPLEFYERCQKGDHISKVEGLILTLKDRLKDKSRFKGLGFTHSQERLVLQVTDSAYKKFSTMYDKVVNQLSLEERLNSVDISVAAESIITSHILPDILGNVRAFFMQEFRCKRCGAKYRRMLLKGSCERCGEEIVQTVYKGAIEKYVNLAEELVRKYVKDEYLRENVFMAVENLKLTFSSYIQDKGEEFREGEQESLERFM